MGWETMALAVFWAFVCIFVVGEQPLTGEERRRERIQFRIGHQTGAENPPDGQHGAGGQDNHQNKTHNIHRALPPLAAGIGTYSLHQSSLPS